MTKNSPSIGIAAALAMILVAVIGANNRVNAGEFANAWHNADSSIVLDAYEYTPIDWSKIPDNKRLVGFINKASDGLSPTYKCGGDQLCRVKWRRYAAAKELYHTRKILAKTLGLKWGAYHLARPGNPVEQAEHFLQFAAPGKDDLIALDIEHNDPKRWMSLEDAEIFSRHIKMRTGRYPVLYTNHHTSQYIADNRAKLPLLSRLNLWYARYKPDVRGVFPMGNWDSYTIWQFSSMVNCNDKSCPWRIAGAGNWIDVNVVAMSPEKLHAAWPLDELQARPEEKPVESEIPVAALETVPTGVVEPASDGPEVAKAVSTENGTVVADQVETEVESGGDDLPHAVEYAHEDTLDNAERGLNVASAGTALIVTENVTHKVDPNEAKLMWVAQAPLPKWRPGAVFAPKVATITVSASFGENATVLNPNSACKQHDKTNANSNMVPVSNEDDSVCTTVVYEPEMVSEPVGGYSGAI